MANSATGAAPALRGSGVRAREQAAPLLRLRTWLRRRGLDADIATGRETQGDPALALRESQLVTARQRRRLAARLEDVVEAPPHARRAASTVPVDGRAVRIASPVLTDLVLLLRSPEAVRARGMALGWRLLTDPGSPVYEMEERESSPPGARLWRESLGVLEALRQP